MNEPEGREESERGSPDVSGRPAFKAGGFVVARVPRSEAVVIPAAASRRTCRGIRVDHQVRADRVRRAARSRRRAQSPACRRRRGARRQRGRSRAETGWPVAASTSRMPTRVRPRARCDEPVSVARDRRSRVGRERHRADARRRRARAALRTARSSRRPTTISRSGLAGCRSRAARGRRRTSGCRRSIGVDRRARARRRGAPSTPSCGHPEAERSGMPRSHLDARSRPSFVKREQAAAGSATSSGERAPASPDR